MQRSIGMAQIGATEVRVARLGLGGAPLGGLFESVSEVEARETVDRAYELDIRYFDTAPYYGHGMSEKRIGEALARYPRSSFTVSSKVGRRLVPTDRASVEDHQFRDTLNFNPVSDFTRSGIETALNQSLERMGLDYLDILFLHDPDEHFEIAMEQTIPTLQELKDKGLVRAIGVGMNQCEMLTRFVTRVSLDCILLAGRYTLLDQSALNALLPLCESKGVSIVLGGPYNSGVLAVGSEAGGHYDYQTPSKPILHKMKQLERTCARYRVSLRAAALQFPAAHPAVASVIPGARSASEVSDNRARALEAIPQAFWQSLSDEKLVDPASPLPAADD